MRQIFKNPEHQAAFDHDGFVVLDWLTLEQVKQLNDSFDKLPAIKQAGFFSGIYSENEEFKRGSHRLLEGLALEFAKAHLIDYRLLVGNFVWKMPGNDSIVRSHQDWTIVDERRFASLNLWCALNDTSEVNGALYLLPRSNRLEYNIRGTLVPDSLREVGDIPCSDMVYLPLRAGQVIVHEHRLVHRSPPNLSNRRRLATAICMVPIESQAIHYFSNPNNGRIEVYEVDTEFFMKYTFGKNRMPDGTRFLRYEDDYQPVQFSREAITALKEKVAA